MHNEVPSMSIRRAAIITHCVMLGMFAILPIMLLAFSQPITVDNGAGYVAVMDRTHTADVSVSYSTSNPGIGAGWGAHCIAADRQDGWLYAGDEC